MTFEEFFKKKRIDLAALQRAEPALFVEFKSHFELMGEKSFDHTKKYWFNNLRHQYHLAPEIKTEKPQMDNPLAEQTVTESLLEAQSTEPVRKAGFVPRFKATPDVKTPVDHKKEEDPPATATSADESPTEAPAKPVYKPRFNVKNIPPKNEV